MIKKEYNIYLGYLLVFLGVVKGIIAFLITSNVISSIFRMNEYGDRIPDIQLYPEVTAVLKGIGAVLAIYSIFVLYKKRKNNEELNVGYILIIVASIIEFIIPFPGYLFLCIIPSFLMISAGILVGNDESENKSLNEKEYKNEEKEIRK